jgi:hypothetical protein
MTTSFADRRIKHPREPDMPWKTSDAQAKTKKAHTPDLRRAWRNVANDVLSETDDEARAIREANAVVRRAKQKAKT